MAVRSLNKASIIGNLTRDPELRYTNSGTAVCTFGVATNRSWTDSDGNKNEATEFHNIVAWAKLAEICHQILATGMMVYIEGSLQTRTWDSDDGHKNYKTEIRVDDLILLDNKGKSGVGSDGSGPAPSDEDQAKGSEKSPEDLLDEIENEESESSDDKDEKKDDSKKSSDEKDEDPLEDEDLPF